MKNLLLPKYEKMMQEFGEDVKLARKRRKLTIKQVSERSGISRSTLYKIERGSISVSIGAYFRVIVVVGLISQFINSLKNDELGRKLQDIELLRSKK